MRIDILYWTQRIWSESVVVACFVHTMTLFLAPFVEELMSGIKVLCVHCKLLHVAVKKIILEEHTVI